MTRNQIDFMRHKEDARHNRAVEQHNVDVLAEEIRHAKATEGETIRHNKSQELIATEANVINAQSVSNQNAHYLRLDAETNRHNLVTEKQAADSLAVVQAQLAETQRHNEATEANQRYSVELQTEETKRHNTQMEQLQNIQAAETERHNVAYEQLQYTTNEISRDRLNWDKKVEIAQLNETQRHNESTEAINEQIAINNFALGLQSNTISERQAGVAESKVDIQYEMLPYDKAGAVSDIAEDWSRVANNIVKSIESAINIPIGIGKLPTIGSLLK